MLNAKILLCKGEAELRDNPIGQDPASKGKVLSRKGN